MAILDVISKWVELVSLVYLTGTVLLRIWVLQYSRAHLCPEASWNEAPFANMWRPFGPVLGLMAAASAVYLLVHVATIAGTSFFPAVNFLPLVISDTHFGRVWLIRIALLVFLAVIFLVSGKRRSERRPLLLLMLAALLLVSMTESASGHPSDKGDLTFRELNDWFHLLAAEAWGGGLIALLTLSLSQITGPADTPASDISPAMVAGIARGFSVMAGPGVAVMAITAVINYRIYVGGAKALLGTPYGLVVAAKIVLFLIIAATGAFNRYVSVPALKQWAGCPLQKPGIFERMAGRFLPPFFHGLEGGRMAVLFKKLVRAEVLLALALLFCAAILSHEPAAKHAMHMKQDTGARRRA